MNAEGFDLKALLAMRHSPVRNYVIPGLTSWLIGNPSPAGTVRLFESEREHQEPICPHSHRFDFHAWVLRGSVRNRLWKTTYIHDRNADLYRETVLTYEGDIGRYVTSHGEITRWDFIDREYQEGQCYSMLAHEVHSIYFSRGALVLLFEGPSLAETSIALEPVTNGETVPTFKIESWMFKREKVAA